MQLTQGKQQILLAQKFNVIPGLRGTRVHEIPALVVQPRDLKQVDDVVDVPLLEAKGHDGPGEVGVALKVVAAAAEHGVDIRVAASAQQVVHAAARLVDPVPGQRVGDDGGQRSHVRQAGPQPVVRGHVRRVQLLCAAGPEALAGVVRIPDVEVACGAFSVRL